jgi:hypothetical protein
MSRFNKLRTSNVGYIKNKKEDVHNIPFPKNHTIRQQNPRSIREIREIRAPIREICAQSALLFQVLQNLLTIRRYFARKISDHFSIFIQ